MREPRKLSVSELRARCSEVLEGVERRREPIVITRYGRPVARLVPIDEPPPTLFGFARGAIAVRGDLLAPIDGDRNGER